MSKHPMTKKGFIDALREAMIDLYGQPQQTGIEGWANDRSRLEKFIERTSTTIRTNSNYVNIEGPAFVKAWQAIGGKGRPTYKALRSLPHYAEDAA